MHLETTVLGISLKQFIYLVVLKKYIYIFR